MTRVTMIHGPTAVWEGPKHWGRFRASTSLCAGLAVSIITLATSPGLGYGAVSELNRRVVSLRGVLATTAAQEAGLMPEEQATPDQLIESHQARLYGFIRCRVRNDAAADDLVQETWTEVWKRIDTYDPNRGSFWTFTKIWAGFVLKRYWGETRVGSEASSTGEHDGELQGGEQVATTAAPEESLQVSEALLELLCRVASCSRPPHEILVFGFAKLTWKPREIVEELSDSALSRLAAQLQKEYTALAPLPTLRVALCPLRVNLSHPLTLLITDPRTRRIYGELLDRITGETALREYYPRGRVPEEVVVQWWDGVKRAVFTEVRKAGRGQLFEWLQARMV